MCTKLRKLIKRYSYIIFPFVVFIISIIFMLIPNNSYYLKLDYQDKITTVLSLSGTFIGVLLTVYTIYIAFPKNTEIYNKVVSSGHDKIFKMNIQTGIFIYVLLILLWVINLPAYILISLFLSGLSNIIISTYYISKLANYI